MQHSEFGNFHEIVALVAFRVKERLPFFVGNANCDALRRRRGHFKSHMTCRDGMSGTGKQYSSSRGASNQGTCEPDVWVFWVPFL